MEIQKSASEVVVTIDNGKNPDGSEAKASWTMRPDQAENHLPMFNAGVRLADGTISKMPKGEQSAIRDIASEFAKQVAS